MIIIINVLVYFHDYKNIFEYDILSMKYHNNIT